MRPDRLFLVDMLDAADAIIDHIAGRDRDALFEDRTARAAVLHELTVIGEAASRITAGLRARHPEVPWSEIVGFRNVVIHRYFGLSWPIIWVTATEDVPVLKAQVVAILDSDFPEEGTSPNS